MNIPWSRWLKRMKQKLGQAPGRKPGRKRPGVLPNLEALEPRDVPTTFTVTTTNDTNAVNPATSPLDRSGNISIRSALEFLNVPANAGTNDMIIVPAGHYLLTAAGGAGQGTAGSLDITDAHGVAIQGAGTASTQIDAQQLDRVMHFHTPFGTNNSLQGLTIENGLAPIGFFTGGNDAAGGGILDESGALTITGCVITNNEAKGLTSETGGNGYGGAIFDEAESDTLTIINSTLSNNKAIGGNSTGSSRGGGGFGGGIFVYFSRLAVQNSTFSGDQAVGGNGANGSGGDGEGGGLDFHADDQSYVISNSTFSGNSAAGGMGGAQGFGGNGYGGAIFSNGSSDVLGTPPNRITNTTIANNQANAGTAPGGGGTGTGQGGGIYNASRGEVGIGSTIIAKNTTNGGVGSGQDVFDTKQTTNGVITSLGFNLIGDDDQPTDDFTVLHHDQVGKPNSPIDPLLGPLQNNGGPTDTLALQPGSPAIDQGSNTYGDVNGDPLAFDQRGPGFLRTVNLPPPNAGDGTDVGAFELQLPTPTLTTTPNVTSVTLGTSPVTLKDTADLEGGLNPTGTITFTLFLRSTLVHTEVVTVNGNGTYTTPTGFTLPGSGTAAGTYQWDATYSGDPFNTTVSDNNDPSERVTVTSTVTPIITTTFVSKVQLLASVGLGPKQFANILFVNALYRQLRGRAPHQNEVNHFVFLLDSGVPRRTVMHEILRSSAHRFSIFPLRPVSGSARPLVWGRANRDGRGDYSSKAI
jgi:hypothetical protein